MVTVIHRGKKSFGKERQDAVPEVCGRDEATRGAGCRASHPVYMQSVGCLRIRLPRC